MRKRNVRRKLVVSITPMRSAGAAMSASCWIIKILNVPDESADCWIASGDGEAGGFKMSLIARSSRNTLPRDKITARSMTFLSSRTLPGQS